MSKAAYKNKFWPGKNQKWSFLSKLSFALKFLAIFSGRIGSRTTGKQNELIEYLKLRLYHQYGREHTIGFRSQDELKLQIMKFLQKHWWKLFDFRHNLIKFPFLLYLLLELTDILSDRCLVLSCVEV